NIKKLVKPLIAPHYRFIITPSPSEAATNKKLATHLLEGSHFHYKWSETGKYLEANFDASPAEGQHYAEFLGVIKSFGEYSPEVYTFFERYCTKLFCKAL
ncbi:hypothetical protein FRB95_001211, partial [Tulasnella sp. JGI-2019a]